MSSLHFSCSYLPLICLSTNLNIQLIHSLLIRIEWTTGNGIFMSSSHWPIYNKLYPEYHQNTHGMDISNCFVLACLVAEVTEKCKIKTIKTILTLSAKN